MPSGERDLPFLSFSCRGQTCQALSFSFFSLALLKLCANHPSTLSTTPHAEYLAAFTRPPTPAIASYSRAELSGKNTHKV